MSFILKHRREILILITGALGGFLCDKQSISIAKAETFPLFTILLPIIALFIVLEISKNSETEQEEKSEN